MLDSSELNRSVTIRLTGYQYRLLEQITKRDNDRLRKNLDNESPYAGPVEKYTVEETAELIVCIYMAGEKMRGAI